MRQALLSSAAIAAVVLASAAQAQEQQPPTTADTAARSDRFDLPGQDLNTSLRAIATRYGVTIDSNAKALRYFRAAPIVDAIDVEDAVHQALVGTGLRATRSVDGQHIGIGRPDPGQLSRDIIVVLAPRSEAETSYLAESSDTANRTGTSNKSVPFSSSIVTAQVLKDQQALTIDDALANIGSVKVSLGNVQGVESYAVRGFTAAVLSNGARVDGGVYQPLDSIERVEALKGPAAILQGNGSLGGAVNVVIKKPTSTPLLDLAVQAGSFGELKAGIDASDALVRDKQLTGRVIASVLTEGRSYGGYDGGHQYLVNPSLRFKTAGLDATIGYSYSDLATPAQPFTMVTTDTHALVDRSGAVGYRNQGFAFRTHQVDLDVGYDITDWLKLVARGHQVWLKSTLLYFLPFSRPTSTSSYILGLRSGLVSDSQTTSGDIYLRAKFSTGPLRHTVSAGYNRSDQSISQFQGLISSDGQANFQRIDLKADAPLRNYGAFTTDPNSLLYSFYRSYGYYAQDLIEAGPVHLFGALRRNIYSNRNVTYFGKNAIADSAWTPSAGAVIDITRQLSLYADWAQGFNPDNVRDKNGNTLPPIKAAQWEAGAKIDLFDHRANLTLSAFQISQTNTKQIDPSVPYNPNNPAYLLAGGRRSRGLEGELKGQLAPGWDISLSATRSWYSYVAQQATLTGDPYASLVKAKATLWTVYRIGQGPLQGFGLGGGINAQSSSTATGLYSAAAGGYLSERIPGYIRADASLYYARKSFDLSLGVKNVFNSKDYAEASTAVFVPVLPPRTVRLTLTWHGAR